jgi:hypothetical protein
MRFITLPSLHSARTGLPMTEFYINLKMSYEGFPSSPMVRGRRGGFLLCVDLCEDKQEDGVVTYSVIRALWKLKISPHSQ